MVIGKKQKLLEAIDIMYWKSVRFNPAEGGTIENCKCTIGEV